MDEKELLKSLDDEISTLDDLLKSDDGDDTNPEGSGSSNTPEELVKSMTDDEKDELRSLLKSDDEDDENKKKKDDDEDDDDDLEKSLLLATQDETYMDATPILKKSVEYQGKISSKLDTLIKSNLAVTKAINALLSQPVGDLPGTGAIQGNLQKSKKDEKGFDMPFKQAKAKLLKSFQDGNLSRDSLIKFEQGGVADEAAMEILKEGAK